MKNDPQEPDNNWAERLAWTNLYRVAPSAGGNPPEGLMKAQLRWCAHLLVRELQLWKPKAAIFITESHSQKNSEPWFHRFKEKMGIQKYSNTGNSLAVGTGTLGGDGWSCEIIVTVRPEGLPGGPSALSQAIATTLRSIGLVR